MQDEQLVPDNLQLIYCDWGLNQYHEKGSPSFFLSIWLSKISARQSKWAIFFSSFWYLGSNNFSVRLEDGDNLDNAFHFDSRESAIAAWEQFKARNNFQRYQELIDVAIALNLDTEPHEFDSVEYAGCLEEGSLIQLPEPTVFALYFRNGELEVLNYSLMVFLKKENCTEADLDQAIAYFTNLQQQSADQAKKILLSV